MGFWHVLLFQLTFCLVVLTCESEESITKSILIRQQQCNFSFSLKVFDSHASLTLTFSFTILSPIAGWLVICDEFFCGEIIVSAHSVFQNMLLLTILFNVWHIFKWSLRSLLLVSCIVIFSLLFYHGAYSSPNAFSFNEFTRAADLTTFFPFRLFPIVRGLIYTGFCMA